MSALDICQFMAFLPDLECKLCAEKWPDIWQLEPDIWYIPV